jgi:hypothetical protein
MATVTHLDVRRNRNAKTESLHEPLTPGFDDAHFWPRNEATEKSDPSGQTRREWAMVGIGLAAWIGVLAIVLAIWYFAAT